MTAFRQTLRRSGPIAGAIGLYFLLGLLLIAQKPGLQYDEALLVSGAVHMQHSATAFDLQPATHSWTCIFPRCIPLMSAVYVGAVKEYASLPFFALFGPRTPVIRLVSLFLSALAIWGIFRLVAAWFDRRAAVVAAFAIAINPAFVTMSVFDNNAIGALMAGLGLTCGCVAIYSTRHSFGAAFAMGAAMGFAVWARANILWILPPASPPRCLFSEAASCFPFRTGWPFWPEASPEDFPFWSINWSPAGSDLESTEGFCRFRIPWRSLLRQRLFLFSDVLLSDGEHRKMWAGPALPAWQLWFFPGHCGIGLSCLRPVEAAPAIRSIRHPHLCPLGRLPPLLPIAGCRTPSVCPGSARDRPRGSGLFPASNKYRRAWIYPPLWL